MKPKVLFICLHRPDRSPSQRFRFEQYLDFLRSEGFDCKHAFLLNEKQDRAFYARGGYFKKAWILGKSFIKLVMLSFFNTHDIVFVQRAAFMLGTSFFERKFAKKSKLVFDFDDTIWRHQPGDFKNENKAFYFLKSPSKTIDIIKVADIVFAGNQYLHDFASNHNDSVKIVPTTIDTEAYPLISKEAREKVCVGWSGSFSTIIHFEHIIGALIKLKAKYGDQVYFKVIGDESYSNSALDIQGIPWRMESEIEDLSEIDIGLMPLPNDEWAKGKCGLKGIQYMALGIPTIMSPVGVNTDIVQEGENGYLAESEAEWIEKTSVLIDSFETRKRIGLKGRATVEARYSVNANKAVYLDIFNSLLKK